MHDTALPQPNDYPRIKQIAADSKEEDLSPRSTPTILNLEGRAPSRPKLLGSPSRTAAYSTLPAARPKALRIRRRAVALRRRFLVAAICAISLSASAQSPDASPARDIARIDSEYSAVSVAKGMPAASVEYFAEDGIAFAPAAVNGKKYWAGRANFPGTLIWQPIFAFAGAAGDLGFTTGPWELKKGNNQPSLGYGHYVTLWSKQPDGKWKIALDVGIENSEPREPPPNLEVLPCDVAAGMRQQEDARRELQKAERKFAEAARNDIGKAIIDSASDDIRVYRDKSFPAVGLVAARLLLESEHGKVMVESGGSKMSSSGDLYYSYGNYSEERGNGVEHGIYVMIWRTNMNGDWKLALNLQKKLPPTKKKQ
jgi:ketosteroid isomerase-like protein